MHRTFIIISIFIVFGCNNKQTHTKKILAVNNITIFLDNDSPPEAEHIGYTGEISDQFKLYRGLINVSDSILLRMTNDCNPKIRVCSMWALAKKKSFFGC